MDRENKEHFMNNMFYGFDTDGTMLRIGAMNMMTHGIENPCIEYRDSLSDQNPDKDKYSLILANPPFKGSLDAEIVSTDLLKICKTKKTELLFLALFIRMLKIGGRCACIVPDGVLFGSSNAHKAIRKELVENQKLENLHLIQQDLVLKPLEQTFDLIIVSRVLHHMPHLDSSLAMFKEHLTLGGQLFIADYTVPDGENHGFIISELEETLKNHGFSDIQTQILYSSDNLFLDKPSQLFLTSAIR